VRVTPIGSMPASASRARMRRCVASSDLNAMWFTHIGSPLPVDTSLHQSGFSPMSCRLKNAIDEPSLRSKNTCQKNDSVSGTVVTSVCTSGVHSAAGDHRIFIPMRGPSGPSTSTISSSRSLNSVRSARLITACMSYIAVM